MENFWVKAIGVTGSVGIVGYLFSLVIQNVFEDKVIAYFGSQNVFYLVVAIVGILGAALILAIWRHRSGSGEGEVAENTSHNEAVNAASIKDSTVNGDIVFGNKTVNHDGGRE